MRLSYTFSEGRQAKSSAHVLLGSQGADSNIPPNYNIYHIENKTLSARATLYLNQRNNLEVIAIISQ